MCVCVQHIGISYRSRRRVNERTSDWYIYIFIFVGCVVVVREKSSARRAFLSRRKSKGETISSETFRFSRGKCHSTEVAGSQIMAITRDIPLAKMISFFNYFLYSRGRMIFSNDFDWLTFTLNIVVVCLHFFFFSFSLSLSLSLSLWFHPASRWLRLIVLATASCLLGPVILLRTRGKCNQISLISLSSSSSSPRTSCFSSQMQFILPPVTAMYHWLANVIFLSSDIDYEYHTRHLMHLDTAGIATEYDEQGSTCFSQLYNIYEIIGK